MGQVYEGKCPLCNYEQQFFLGGGMMSVNLEMSAGVLPEDEQAVLRQMKERQEIARFNVENFIVECPECHKITGKTIIEVAGKDGRRHILEQYRGRVKVPKVPGRNLTIWGSRTLGLV